MKAERYRPGITDPRERFSNRVHLLIEPDVHGWPEAYFVMIFDVHGSIQEVHTHQQLSDAEAEFDAVAARWQTHPI